jgi:hypothetical protein
MLPAEERSPKRKASNAIPITIETITPPRVLNVLSVAIFEKRFVFDSLPRAPPPAQEPVIRSKDNKIPRYTLHGRLKI